MAELVGQVRPLSNLSEVGTEPAIVYVAERWPLMADCRLVELHQASGIAEKC